jgi:hypothetical protein
MCSVECGDEVSSHGNMPVSTPSITTHGQGLSLLIALTCCVCLVRRWDMDLVNGVRLG